jgi:uncharacterized protein (DUF433 family)
LQLHNYFDFLAPDDIRLKGTRIGIENILYEYIHRAQTPEQIAQRFHTITLEQVYATILYYLRNRDVVHAYLTDWLAWGHEMRTEQEHNPPPAIVRLRQLLAAQATPKATTSDRERTVDREVPAG